MARPKQALRYLLLQARVPGDPMREHEVDCFSRVLECDPENIQTHDLIAGRPSAEQVQAVDAVVIGGSGDFSVAEGGPWLPEALETFVSLFEEAKPTFASCWGFQAFARALGGEVVTDLSRAELGTVQIHLTEVGKRDPIFGPLGTPFSAPMGHQDIVDRLPRDAVLLASSDKVENQAFTFEDKLIYATQFHPELSTHDLIRRLQTYPSYVKNITGMEIDEFVRHCRPTPGASTLLHRFADHLSEAVVR